MDSELIVEAGRYRLRFACPDCAFFAPVTGACSEGYPNHAHRDARLEPSSCLEFCKSFELA